MLSIGLFSGPWKTLAEVTFRRFQVLDYGCGREFYFRAAQRWDRKEVYALDIHALAWKRSRKSLEKRTPDAI